jgi:hypothetical protein
VAGGEKACKVKINDYNVQRASNVVREMKKGGKRVKRAKILLLSKREREEKYFHSALAG